MLPSFAQYRKSRLNETSTVLENVNKRFDLLKTDLLEAVASPRVMFEGHGDRADYILERIMEEDRQINQAIIEAAVKHFKRQVHHVILENVGTAPQDMLKSSVTKAVRGFIAKVKQSISSQVVAGHAPAGAAGVAADANAAPGAAPDPNATPDPSNNWNQSLSNHYLGRNSTYNQPNSQSSTQSHPGQQGPAPAGFHAPAQPSNGSWFSRKSTHPLMKWANIPKTALKWLKGAYQGDYLDDHTVHKLATVVETMFHENDQQLLATIDQFGQELEREILSHVDQYLQQASQAPKPMPGSSPTPPAGPAGMPAASPTGMADPSAHIGRDPNAPQASGPGPQQFMAEPEGPSSPSRRGHGVMTDERYKANRERIRNGDYHGLAPGAVHSMLKQDFEKGLIEKDPGSMSPLEKFNAYRAMDKLPPLPAIPEKPKRDFAEVEAELAKLKAQDPAMTARFLEDSVSKKSHQKMLRNFAAVLSLPIKKGAGAREYLNLVQQITEKLPTWQPRERDEAEGPVPVPGTATAPQNSADVATMLKTAHAEPASTQAQATSPAAPDDASAQADALLGNKPAPMADPSVHVGRDPSGAAPDETMPHVGSSEVPTDADYAAKQADEPIPEPPSADVGADIDAEDDARKADMSMNRPGSAEVKMNRIKDALFEKLPHLHKELDSDPRIEPFIRAQLGKVSEQEIIDNIVHILSQKKPGAPSPEAAPEVAPEAPQPSAPAKLDPANEEGLLQALSAKTGKSMDIINGMRGIALKQLAKFQAGGMSPEDAVDALAQKMTVGKPAAPAAPAPAEEEPVDDQKGWFVKPSKLATEKKPKKSEYKPEVSWDDPHQVQDSLTMAGLVEPHSFKELMKFRSLSPDITVDKAVDLLDQYGSFKNYSDEAKRKILGDDYDDGGDDDSGPEDELEDGEDTVRMRGGGFKHEESVKPKSFKDFGITLNERFERFKAKLEKRTFTILA